MRGISIQDLHTVLKKDPVPFAIETFCFKEQIAFIQDPAPFKTAVCSRRSGKTVSCAADLIATALRNPNRVCVYITLSRRNAKQIVWNDMLQINRTFNLKGEANQSELFLKFPNGSTIYLSGAKHKAEIENFRGLAITKCYIDECFHAETLIDTPDGPQKISALQVGHLVNNAKGTGEILSISRKQIANRIDLGYGGKIITCSLNHPFFTSHGWIDAGHLREGDLLAAQSFSMFTLQLSDPKSLLWKSSYSAFLFDQMFKKMGTRENENSQPHAFGQSHEAGKSSQESESISQKDGVASFGAPREWSWANRPRETDSSRTSRSQMESCHRDQGPKEDRLSSQLQSGSGLCSCQTCDRSGWEQSQSSFEKDIRSKERSKAHFTRVDSTQIYQSGSDGTSEKDYFYDLEVSGHPSYSVNGVLVHNCQSFKHHIEELIDDVISKALFDYNGTLCLIGTPGPIPMGYFYDCAHSDQWAKHSWTMFENPYLLIKSGKTPKELLERELKRKGITSQDATIQRECFAQWVIDINALVFRYDPIRNGHSREMGVLPRWEYVVGVDLGYEDSDAIAVIGWDPTVKHAYLVSEHVRAKQGISELALQLESIIKEYDPLRIVMDTGGLGKKIAEEIQKRYSLPIKAAEKVRKFEYIELLNDALRTGRFFARPSGPFASDTALVEWEKNIENPEKLKISERFHSDIADAVLYAFRESLHWLSEAEPIKIKKGSPEWMQEQIDRMEEVALQQLENKNEHEIWGDLEQHDY
jgi:hypothetical protein